LVSIVINNYNYARYLAQAIDSALSQTATPVEVVVVDDGSTDNSREVIGGYGNRIVPVFKDNGGQASAVNVGFAHSHGQVVIFLDADDILLPMAAARVADVFAARPGTAKVQYRMSVVDAQGRETGTLRPPPHIPLQSGDLRRQEVSFPFDLAWAAMSANAFSDAVLRQVLPIPAERYGRAGADWYLAHVAALLGEVCALDEVCALYRVHGTNQYGGGTGTIDIAQVRQSVRYADVTRAYLQSFADRLSIRRPATILSVSDVANRLTSLRLDPAQHPLPGDTPAGLLGQGLRAAGRRFDIRWPMKAMFMAWFMAMAVAPPALARGLAEQFFYPEKRRGLNRWLGRWHVRAAS
jgi:glycosyltransferase involved in cell wall biosynthesis